MQKFVFNMQKILNLRKFEEKQAQAELGKAVSAEARIQDTLDLLAEQNVQTVKNSKGIKDVLEELAQAQLETEQKREKMKDAMLKVKALEKLKEARQRDWALENKRKEEKELDDIVNSKQFRT